MKYFVSSDIHGFYDEWITALNEKHFNINDSNHMIIVCGDLFDRGKKPVELQNFILELMSLEKIILVKGNHEDLLLNMLNNWHKESYLEWHHIVNGTVDTVLHLTDSKTSDIYNDPENLYRKMRTTPFMQKILPAMVDYFETKNYIFVHGWMPCYTTGEKKRPNKYFYNNDWRNADKEEFNLCRWYNGMDAARQGVIEPNKTIVCGHWKCSYGHAIIERKGSENGEDADFSPYKAKGIIAIDACTVESKKVNVVVIDD